jgi:hypothetical protein
MTYYLRKEIEMVMDWQAAVGLVSALTAVVGWHSCQTWQTNRPLTTRR